MTIEMEKSLKIKYSLMVFPVAFAGIPIYIFLPDYYHNYFGLSLTVLSITLFVLRVLDALVDPFIGWYCDRFPRQHKKSFIVIVALFILGFYILCNPMIGSRLINLLIGVLLSTLAYSYLTIFINTQGALWKKGQKEKADIISLREIFNIIGVLVASILPFILMSILSVQTSYFVYSLIFSVIIIFTSIKFLQWYCAVHKQNNTIKKDTYEKSYGYKYYFAQMNQQGKFLFLSYSISALGSAIPAVMLAFYSRYVLQMPQYTGLYLFLYFLGTIIAIPFVRKLALRYGEVHIWMYAIIIAIIIFMCAFFLNKGDILAFSIISFTSGLCFSAELILPNLLLAQWIDTKERNPLGNGYYALLSFIGKFSFALATIVTLPWLDVQIAINTVDLSNVILIKVLYCLLPCLIKAAALISLFIWQARRQEGGVK